MLERDRRGAALLAHNATDVIVDEHPRMTSTNVTQDQPYHITLVCISRFFWATVCKTVRPMLSDRCLSCDQTVGWIKRKLGTEVGQATLC